MDRNASSLAVQRRSFCNDEPSKRRSVRYRLALPIGGAFSSPSILNISIASPGVAIAKLARRRDPIQILATAFKELAGCHAEGPVHNPKNWRRPSKAQRGAARASGRGRLTPMRCWFGSYLKWPA